MLRIEMVPSHAKLHTRALFLCLVWSGTIDGPTDSTLRHKKKKGRETTNVQRKYNLTFEKIVVFVVTAHVALRWRKKKERGKNDYGGFARARN